MSAGHAAGRGWEFQKRQFESLGAQTKCLAVGNMAPVVVTVSTESSYTRHCSEAP